MTEFKQALDDRPNLVGTPGTNAYQRSNERTAQWYARNFQTISRALKIAHAVTSEPSDGMRLAGSREDLGDLRPSEAVAVFKHMIAKMLEELE